MFFHTRKDIGRIGEDLALNYYQKLGFRLIDKNWRCFTSEIDLILEKDKILYFIEVKTIKKYPNSNFQPELNLTWIKKQKFKKGIFEFLQFKKKSGFSFQGFRTEAICLTLTQDYQILKINRHKNFLN